MRVCFKRNGTYIPPIFSQTRTVILDSYVEYGDEESAINISSDEPQFDEIVKQLNNVFDDIDEYLSADLKAIIDHRSSNGVLDFKDHIQMEMSNGIVLT